MNNFNILGESSFENPYPSVIVAPDFSTPVYPSINTAIANSSGTPQPYSGTWIATDFESQTQNSINDTLQKIDNFQPSTLNQTNINGNVNIQGSKILNLGTPTLTTDATNKLYVDNIITSNISTNYQFGVIGAATLSTPNNVSVIHNATINYATTRLYAQPDVLNYFSCILPNISTLPNRNFPENYLRVGFLDAGIFPNGYVAYLSLFNVAGVPSYNISWGSNGYDPTDFQFAAGDRVQITIDGFANTILYEITGAFPNSQTNPYIGSITQIRASVGFLQASPSSPTGNIYTFTNVLFEQSEPISFPVISLASVGTGLSLINNGTIPSLTTKSLRVSGTGISTLASTATDLIISSIALPTTGGIMSGVINSLNILPVVTNTNSVGTSTFPYLNSEATTINTKTITIWNSARTLNNNISSVATSTHPYTLPPTQGAVNSVLRNNGAGLLTWVSGSSSITQLYAAAEMITPFLFTNPSFSATVPNFVSIGNSNSLTVATTGISITSIGVYEITLSCEINLFDANTTVEIQLNRGATSVKIFTVLYSQNSVNGGGASSSYRTFYNKTVVGAEIINISIRRQNAFDTDVILTRAYMAISSIQ